MKTSGLVVLVVAFASGVAVRTLVELPAIVSVWLLFLALMVGIVWRGRQQVPAVLYLGLLLLALAAGICRTEIASWQFGSSVLQPMVGQSVEVVGVVVKEPEHQGRTVSLYVLVGEDTLLVTADTYTAIAYGDTVRVSGVLEEPTTFTTSLGREFNYKNYLQAKGVEYKIAFAQTEVIAQGAGNKIIAGLLFGKAHFISAIQQIIPEPAVGLGAGLLLGVKSALGDDIENDFRQTGIIHIVVLSGYNIMLVVAFMMFCFSSFLSRKLQVLAGVLAIISFALIVGLSATVVRASIMAVLVLVAGALRRQYDVLRALLLAGVAMLWVNPYLLLYDIGFQLSFMATLGLILVVPQFEARLAAGSWFGMKEFLLATVATQLTVLPLLLYHIGEVSVIAVVVNVLVLPIVPLAMLLTFLTGVVALVSLPLAGLVGYLATWSLWYILGVAKWFADLPFAAVSVPSFSAGYVGLLYALLLGGWLFAKTQPKAVPAELSGWTVVEETESVDPPVGVSTDVKELPIFFR